MARPIMCLKCSTVQIQPMGLSEIGRCMAVEGLGRFKAYMTIGHPLPRATHRLFSSLDELFSVAFFLFEKGDKRFTDFYY